MEFFFFFFSQAILLEKTKVGGLKVDPQLKESSLFYSVIYSWMTTRFSLFLVHLFTLLHLQTSDQFDLSNRWSRRAGGSIAEGRRHSRRKAATHFSVCPHLAEPVSLPTGPLPVERRRRLAK